MTSIRNTNFPETPSAGQAQVDYWKQLLAGAPDLLELPTDKPRPAVQSLDARRLPFALGQDLYQRVLTLCGQENCSLRAFLAATFQGLLSRYTEQKDIVLGVSVPTRIAGPHTAEDIGRWVNEIPLRAGFEEDVPFSDFLRRTSQALAQAQEHQTALAEFLQSQGARPASHHWFYQAALLLEETTEPLQIDGHPVRISLRSELDLALEVRLTPTHVETGFVYASDLFEESTVARIASHWTTLLESILANPQTPISRLNILPVAEKQTLLVDWNQTQSNFPRQQCIHRLFEAQVRKSPQATALVFGDEALSYQELNHHANALAARLVQMGIGPDVPVAICMERRMELIVGILGILKAGGAYVPMDPNYPAERLAMILEDSKTPLLITQTSLRDKLPPHSGQVLFLDDFQAISTLAAGSSNPQTAVTCSNLAYIIYTSGSTGRPKGVAIEHQSAVTLAHWARTVYSDAELAGVLFATSVCFDLSVFEMFVPLSWGGKIILAENALQLPKLSAAWQVTLVNTVPSAMAELVRMRALPPTVSVVNLAGEPLETNLVRAIYALNTVEKVYDLYGPTEDTVYSTFSLRTASGPQTIGRPLADTQVYLLDRHLQPVPIGVPGELHIGGCGLARGYYLQPELTAKKFIPNPFSDAPDARLYKTGDLARYRPDGTIQFLGRIDNQVKIRGFRIELGDIENALRQSPMVLDTVVMAREDTPGDKKVVAYVVQNSSDSTEAQGTQVDNWQDVWDGTYARPVLGEATFNLIGWTSSYTGEQVSAPEMKEWVEGTVTRILQLKPQRILEIGCGTGLLLFRLAPHCAHYCGSDFSGQVITNLRDQLSRQEGAFDHVALRKAEGADFSGLEPASFDTVVINSVSQYFPDIHYFLKVLEGAVRVLKPGGRIFVGDVRSYSLLETFATSVAFHNAAASEPVDVVKENARRLVQDEQELTVAPEFFSDLKAQFPQISRAEIQLKPGRCNNEVTRYRYDVVLHLEQTAEVPVEEVHDWQKDSLTLAKTRSLLDASAASSLALVNVPNARLSADIALSRILASPTCPSTVERLRQAVQNDTDPAAVEPEDFWSMVKEMPFEVRIEWAKDLGCFNVLFQRHGMGTATVATLEQQNRPTAPAWGHYANNPIRNASLRQLVPALRQWLKAKLPEYMIPSAFVLLPALPLLPNGKVNRKALPPPDHTRADLDEGYVAPATTTEELLARIWAEVLGLPRVGTRDNFFELGGHSLMATQVLSRLREQIQLDLPMRSFFEAPSISALAQVVESTLAAEIASLSEEEAERLGQGLELSSRN
jgi:amino acid adenylation domain-containing protein